MQWGPWVYQMGDTLTIVWHRRSLPVGMIYPSAWNRLPVTAPCAITRIRRYHDEEDSDSDLQFLPSDATIQLRAHVPSRLRISAPPSIHPYQRGTGTRPGIWSGATVAPASLTHDRARGSRPRGDYRPTASIEGGLPPDPFPQDSKAGSEDRTTWRWPWNSSIDLYQWGWATGFTGQEQSTRAEHRQREGVGGEWEEIRERPPPTETVTGVVAVTGGGKVGVATV